MAEENELDQSKKKSKTMLIVIIVVVVNLVIGGVVVVVMMSGGGGESAPPAAGGAGAAVIPRASGEGPGPLIQLDNFVVNIQSDEGAKYLKAAIVVELGDPAAQETFNQWEQLVRNEVLVFLSSLEVAETITVKQKRLVETRLKNIINKRIGAELAVGVYFTEFVTQ